MGCILCPRNCDKDRAAGEKGVCSVSGKGIFLARAALHMWEEPCISGTRGSGTVFFTGCPLKCVYCQNYLLSTADLGKEVDEARLAEIFLELQAKGAHNINLVTPTHYTDQIIPAILAARGEGLSLPIVYNCSGYEKVETLKTLEGVVDIYLTDFKYMEREAAARYSKAPDYPEIAKAALEEMVRQCPKPEFDEEGMMTKGVIVRHLLLPGHVKNAKAVTAYCLDTYGDSIYMSLMNQYTPLPQVTDRFPELSRRVTRREYERFIAFALEKGLSRGFIQEGKTAKESFIPLFDYEGV